VDGCNGANLFIFEVMADAAPPFLSPAPKFLAECFSAPKPFIG
jgi:hypothetical protein